MPRPNPNALSRLKTVPSIIPNVQTTPLGDEGKRNGARLVSKQEIVLTQEKAAWYIDLPVFEGERDVTEAHVQKLLDKMVSGTFNPQVVIIANCIFDGKIWKINGQHTCWAKFFLPHYTPTVMEHCYEASSLEEMQILYAQFDSNKPRSDSHLLRVYMAGIPEFQGIWSDTIKRLSTGLRIWYYQSVEDNRRATAENISALIREKYPELIRIVGLFWQSLPDKQRDILRRAPCYAAMIATFEKDPVAASQFWIPVTSGAELKINDPRLILRNFLTSHVLDTKGITSSKKVINQNQMFWVCLTSWNKWRNGNTVTVLRMPKERPTVE